MQKTIFTTKGVYREGIVVPDAKPRGRRMAVVTFFPPGSRTRKSDEALWKELEPTARRVRKSLFRETYASAKTKTRKTR